MVAPTAAASVGVAAPEWVSGHDDRGKGKRKGNPFQGRPFLRPCGPGLLGQRGQSSRMEPAVNDEEGIDRNPGSILAIKSFGHRCVGDGAVDDHRTARGNDDSERAACLPGPTRGRRACHICSGARQGWPAYRWPGPWLGIPHMAPKSEQAMTVAMAGQPGRCLEPDVHEVEEVVSHTAF